MQEKQRCMILFFFDFLIISSAGSFLASMKSTGIIRWPPRRVTALQVMRTSFLGPRRRLFPHPHFEQQTENQQTVIQSGVRDG